MLFKKSPTSSSALQHRSIVLVSTPGFLHLIPGYFCCPIAKLLHRFFFISQHFFYLILQSHLHFSNVFLFNTQQ
jgi:hypothetical protein